MINEYGNDGDMAVMVRKHRGEGRKDYLIWKD